VNTVTALKEKIKTEIGLNAHYAPPAAERLKKMVTPPAPMPDPDKKIYFESLDPILVIIQNNSINLYYISDQINLLYKPEYHSKSTALARVMPKIVEAFEKGPTMHSKQAS
jgi:hypothetical protein